MSKEQEIFNYLHEIGCCKSCCLRYLCVRNPEIYNKQDIFLQEKKYLIEDTIPDNNVKKSKNNPCIVCLGLLQDFCIEETIYKICQSELVSSYDSEVFTISVSYPASIQIREFSMRADLDKKFPDFYTFETMETQINKTWKWIIRNSLAKKLNKTFENSDTCDFSINISMSYELDDEELAILQKVQPEYFAKRQIQKKKFRGELFSRKGVQTVLEATKPGVFREFFPVPPTVSDKQLICDKIDANHNSVYIAGRYCKFSRELSQTPWIINGVKTMESSVQEIIFEPFIKFLHISEENLKFSSSGREDVDVRCLGNGRPFYIEILNPKKTKFTFNEFRNIEKFINKSSDIKVKDLQLVKREDLSFIKEGEESKTKQYEALCICKDKTPSNESLKRLEAQASLILKQKTPIRVLHRRPLAIRNRTVYSIKTEKIDGMDNVFKLFLTTQAGTYVKEFVHGDFGRTVPNVGQILGQEVDILCLDVLAIDLDWPKPVFESNIT